MEQLMKATIGRIFFSIAVCSTACDAATMQLQTFTLQGTPFQIIGAGQPFVLEVSVKDLQGSYTEKPTIKGLERFTIQGSGYTMSTLNGQTQITYKYTVRIDQPGSYDIGPAELVVGQTSVQSNAVQVHVSTTTQAPEQKSKKGESVLLRLSCDKKNVVIGEKVRCALRFYSEQPNTQIQNVNEPNPRERGAYEIKKKENPVFGKEKINGIEYHFAQWQWDLYPLKEGQCTIPAYAIDYTVPDTARAQFFGGLFSFNQTKKIYSNALTLSVAGLPPSSQKPQAVGVFSRLAGTITPQVTQVGGGLVLTYSLTGDADFDSIAFNLRAMPEECKWYDSKSCLDDQKNDGNFVTKNFEYIVQPTKEDRLEIPAQEWYYYDTVAHSYKTLRAPALSVHVVAANAPQSQIVDHQESLATQIDAPIPLYNYQEPVPERAIPMKLFLFLLILATIAWAILLFYRPLVAYFQSFVSSKKDPFKRALSQVNAARKADSTADLYPIFLNLFATIIGCPVSQLSQEMIIAQLVRMGATEHTILSWNDFFSKISEALFYTKHSKPTRIEENLFDTAVMWIKTLQEKFK